MTANLATITSSTVGTSLQADCELPTLADFYEDGSDEIFSKCSRFAGYVREVDAAGMFRSQYRLELVGPIDHRIRVKDPESGQLRELICFDSNSYLGLHLHPRVVEMASHVLSEAGLGCPSAQLLAGTHRWLRELEETVANFHDRQAAIVFPSGYAANVGTLTALLRPGDVVARDRYCHASIHDGCLWSGAATDRGYRHNDINDLERLLNGTSSKRRGKLVVTDGVFSMHGHLAPLPELSAIAKKHGARLMIDEAHCVGVLGATGRGLEEHFGMPGSIDIIMSTFSKAPGAVGGYVCASEDVVQYLRFFARASMFTASLPPSMCAGLTEAFRIMKTEPEHRERLWQNARRLHSGLCEVGYPMEPLSSPILTIAVGSQRRLLAVSRFLYQAGIKCGSVSYPAVPKNGCLLRLSVNARHQAQDLDRSIDVLGALRKSSLGNDVGVPTVGLRV
jgi:4-hydroxy-2,2'-bipyrrole-5-methanol synthase